MFRASQSPKMGPGGWLDCKRVPPFQLMRSVVVPTTFLFGLPGAPGAGRWEPRNCERAEPGLHSQCQGRPHSALSLCLLASTSQTRTQQTNQPPRAEPRAIDFPTPFPTSVSVSPTKHHQNPRAPEPPSPRAPIVSIASAAVLCDRLGCSSRLDPATIDSPSLPAPHARRPPIDSPFLPALQHGVRARRIQELSEWATITVQHQHQHQLAIIPPAPSGWLSVPRAAQHQHPINAHQWTMTNVPSARPCRSSDAAPTTWRATLTCGGTPSSCRPVSPSQTRPWAAPNPNSPRRPT